MKPQKIIIALACLTMYGQIAAITSYAEDMQITEVSVQTVTADYPVQTDCKIELSQTAYTYDGTEKKPNVKVMAAVEDSAAEGGYSYVELTSNDYDVEYTNNINVGTATAKVTLKGNYEGTATQTFKINAAAISSANVSLSDDNAVYNGGLKTVGTTVKVGTKTLVNGTDYTVSYTNNRNIGKATVTVKGKGNYSGTVTKTFNIIPQTVTVKSDYSCTTNAIRINWNKVSNATGYRIYRFNGKNWRSVATVRGADTTTYKDHNYSVTLYQYKVKAYTKVDGTNYWGNASAEKYASTKSKGVKITSASTTSSAVRLNWTKQDGNGYQIYQKINGKYVKIATVRSANTTTYRVENLNANTKYSFKVRAYRTDTQGRVNAGTCGSKSVKTDDISELEKIQLLRETNQIKFSKEVLELINKERTSRGLNPVTTDPIISSVAQTRAKQIVTNFSHDLDGVDAGDLLRKNNYSFGSWGENIAWNQESAQEVMEDWMNSTDGHRENILNPNWTKAGIGCYYAVERCFSPYSMGEIFWVQVFAS